MKRDVILSTCHVILHQTYLMSCWPVGLGLFWLIFFYISNSAVALPSHIVVSLSLSFNSSNFHTNTYEVHSVQFHRIAALHLGTFLLSLFTLLFMVNKKKVLLFLLLRASDENNYNLLNNYLPFYWIELFGLHYLL